MISSGCDNIYTEVLSVPLVVMGLTGCVFAVSVCHVDPSEAESPLPAKTRMSSGSMYASSYPPALSTPPMSPVDSATYVYSAQRRGTRSVSVPKDDADVGVGEVKPAKVKEKLRLSISDAQQKQKRRFVSLAL